MEGIRTFIHHSNVGNSTYPTTRAILQTLDTTVDRDKPLIVPFLGKTGTGKTRLLEHWANIHRPTKRNIDSEPYPILMAEIIPTEKNSLGRKVYTTATACVTFSSMVYVLGEYARHVDRPEHTPQWYRQERSLYTDQQFLWLFDQVCREARRLRVRAFIIEHAERLDVPTMATLLRLRKRLDNRLGLILSARLEKNEQLDEPMGKVFDRARVDMNECHHAIELCRLNQDTFYTEVVVPLLHDLDAEVDEAIAAHGAWLAETLWIVTAGDWNSIASRIRHLNRLLPPRGHPQRKLTRSILEQVLARKVPT